MSDWQGDWGDNDGGDWSGNGGGDWGGNGGQWGGEDKQGFTTAADFGDLMNLYPSFSWETLDVKTKDGFKLKMHHVWNEGKR